jgi:hypothetical protein
MKTCTWLLALAVGIVCLCAAASFAAKPDSLKLAVLRASVTGVQGWTEQKDQFRSFGTKELYELIDGGAVEYEKPGLVGGILVVLSGPNKEAAEIYIEDFGTPSRAQGMVKAKRKNASEPKSLEGARARGAFFDGVIGGCVAYASVNAFYMELALTGYDSAQKAAGDAKIFVSASAGAR